MTVLDGNILPRIWLGNAITTPTHLDEWNNIGCVVSWPPPVHSVSARADLQSLHRTARLRADGRAYEPGVASASLISSAFRDSVKPWRAAVGAELGPGDALYIPPLWWHHVESLERFNVLVNYWWHSAGGPPAGAPAGFDTLFHAVLSLRALPPTTREAWRALFDHYVFGPERGVTEHIPAHRRGILGKLSATEVARLLAHLVERLKK